MRLIKYGYQNPMEELIKNFLNQEEVNESQECYVPKSNILEKDDKYEIEIAAPGFRKKDIHLDVEENVLKIRAEKEDDTSREYTLREFGTGNLERDFYLPDDINQQDISATLNNGILTISLPKKEEAKAVRKQIEIS